MAETSGLGDVLETQVTAKGKAPIVNLPLPIELGKVIYSYFLKHKKNDRAFQFDNQHPCRQ